ncbi:MAG: NAD-dependent epimerase/dehydratase family protein, partial [Ferruginibacter sp.]
MNDVKGLRVIITGASGMVGEGVLFECLRNEAVSSVLVVGRRLCGTTHPKMKEIIHADFTNLAPVENALSGYDACFFCLGISSLGMKEETYRAITYDVTMHMANTLLKMNAAISFCYVSGAGTDTIEKGRLMWARIKGKTENDLAALPFKAAYNFRPGMLIPTAGQHNILKAYKYFSWLVPIMKAVYPKGICSLEALGKAMI